MQIGTVGLYSISRKTELGSFRKNELRYTHTEPSIKLTSGASFTGKPDLPLLGAPCGITQGPECAPSQRVEDHQELQNAAPR